MPKLPNRCQHLKVNGTQCGSPALRRHRFCYFHQLHHEEVITPQTDRARSDRAKTALPAVSLPLPVLEDANSIQVTLMQIMRLIVTGQIDSKTAGLLLYALQTASANLAQTRFQPYKYDVVLDPSRVGQTPLDGCIWKDGDFDNDTEEDDSPDQEPRQDERAAAEEKQQAVEKKVRTSERLNQQAARPAVTPQAAPSSPPKLQTLFPKSARPRASPQPTSRRWPRFAPA